jgi:hypothetical protein
MACSRRFVFERNIGIEAAPPKTEWILVGLGFSLALPWRSFHRLSTRMHRRSCQWRFNSDIEIQVESVEHCVLHAAGGACFVDRP